MRTPGTWWLTSATDPRWVAHGTGEVGGMIGPNQVPEAKKAMDALKKKYGNPPEDLEWGYTKD